jgi:excinuclease ABC subunit A
MGPEAGDEGGYVVVAGTPEEVAEYARGQKSEVRGRKSGKKNIENTTPSHTGAALIPILAAGPHAPRKRFDFAAADAEQAGDRDINEVGKDARMPWEIDGRHWHTVARVGRNGKPCHWEGRILAEIVDRIQSLSAEHQPELFSETDWNSRSIVEISATKKSDGWFFHAITGEEWLLKMKFRTAANTFSRDELVKRLDLKPLNDMRELPLYGTEPRVKVRSLNRAWQEIELRVHGYSEIDRPEFWQFVDEAVAGFGKFSQKTDENAAILMPWKQLGRKWHFARRGFTLGSKVEWEMRVLEELFEMLSAAAPYGQIAWENKQVVPIHVPQQKEAWAAVQTKKLDAVYLHLTGPKGRFAQGRLTDLGFDPSVDGDKPGLDVLHLKFRSLDDLRRGDLAGFLKEHLAALGK